MCAGVCVGGGLEGNLGSDWMPFVPFIPGRRSHCFDQDVFLPQMQKLEQQEQPTPGPLDKQTLGRELQLGG